MTENAPNVATHLMRNSDSYLTAIGKILRKTSLDELPQLYSILMGQMSFVGPRPALFNQYDLIELRTKYDIDKIKPGLTGWSQINGRDDLTIEQKVDFDTEYLNRKSFIFDLLIIYRTAISAVRQNDISH
jgi:O-antigen biosynthesis protein WbqP